MKKPAKKLKKMPRKIRFVEPLTPERNQAALRALVLAEIRQGKMMIDAALDRLRRSNNTTVLTARESAILECICHGIDGEAELFSDLLK